MRQEIVAALHIELGVPYERMTVEYPLHEIDPSCRDRADIVVWGNPAAGRELHPLAVFELKAPEKRLSGFTWEQAEAYADVLGAPFVAIANSGRLRDASMTYTAPGGAPRNLHVIPTYAEMLKGAALQFAPDEPLLRLSYDRVCAPERVQGLLDGAIGLDTPPSLHAFIAELDNFLLCEPLGREAPIEFRGLQIMADGGISDANYENAGGGSYAGLYRTWLVREPNAGDQVYRVGTFAHARTRNHAAWGNRRGTTAVLVGTDDPELGYHCCLQLTLDVGCELDAQSNTYELIHDGRMTVGKLGRLRNAEVIDFVRARSPRLAQGNRVVLGALPANRSISWAEGEHFVLNLLEYAFLRDQLREQLRGP